MLLVDMNAADAAHIAPVYVPRLVHSVWNAAPTAVVDNLVALLTCPCMSTTQSVQILQAVGSHFPKTSHVTAPVLGLHAHTVVVETTLQNVPAAWQSLLALQLPVGACHKMFGTALPPDTPYVVHKSNACGAAPAVMATLQGVACVEHSASDWHNAATRRPRFPATLFAI